MLMNMKTKTLIIILGPTAIGKTSISIKLAKHYNTQIISADSRQFYKELKIGAAPPSKEELSEVQHHFIHNLSVNEDYNVGKFEEDALRKIEELLKEKEKIIMVGGSGLYIDAICKGFDKMPDTSKEIRNKVISLYKEKGIKFLQSELKENDPIYFNEVDIQNSQRLMRALEVIYSTGKPFSKFRKEQVKKRSFNIVKIGLDMNREDLYKRINKRVDVMIENGLLYEVESLLNHRNKNSLQTVGYKELFEHLDGKNSQEEAIDMIKKNTRRFAKRQISWFKRDHTITHFATNKTKEIIKFIG